MDFNIKKPEHFFAFIILSASLFLVIVLPFLVFFLGSTSTIDAIKITDSLMILNVIIILAIFLGAPFFWYLLVNQLSIKQMLSSLKLRIEGIDQAILWGTLAAILIVILEIVISTLLVGSGIIQKDFSNAPMLFAYTSPFVMLFVILVQSPVEEIFFRGFLLQKIDALLGKKIAIILAAVLFGLAHFSYDAPLLVLVIILMGIIMGFIFVKTKNLFSSITAHLLVNMTAFVLYLIGKSLNV